MESVWCMVLYLPGHGADKQTVLSEGYIDDSQQVEIDAQYWTVNKSHSIEATPPSSSSTEHTQSLSPRQQNTVSPVRPHSSPHDSAYQPNPSSHHHTQPPSTAPKSSPKREKNKKKTPSHPVPEPPSPLRLARPPLPTSFPHISNPSQIQSPHPDADPYK